MNRLPKYLQALLLLACGFYPLSLDAALQSNLAQEDEKRPRLDLQEKEDEADDDDEQEGTDEQEEADAGEDEAEQGDDEHDDDEHEEREVTAKEIREFAKKHAPDFLHHIKELAEEFGDEEANEILIDRGRDLVLGFHETRETHGRRMGERFLDLFRVNFEIDLLVESLEDEELASEDAAELKKEVTELVTRRYVLQLALEKAELNRLKAEVDDFEEEIKNRVENRKSIIEDEIDEILGELDAESDDEDDDDSPDESEPDDDVDEDQSAQLNNGRKKKVIS